MYAKFYQFQSFLTNFDLFGHKVDFYINNNRRVKSKIGAILSVMMLALILFLFVMNWTAWMNFQNLQTISTTESFSIMELLTLNESYVYDFNPTNFYLYFSISATFPNGTLYNHGELQRYLTQNFIFQDSNNTNHDLGAENCLFRNQKVFIF